MFKIAVYSLIIFIIMIICSEHLACKPNFDPDFISLYNKLSKPGISDSAKIALRISLTNKYISVDPNEGIKVGSIALIIAKKSNRSLDIATCYNNIGLNYWAKSDYANALMNYLNAEAVFKAVNSNRGLAKVYHNISNIYASVAQYDKAKSYLDSAIKYNTKTKRKPQLAVNYMNLVEVLLKEHRYNEALQSLYKALHYNNLYSNNLYSEEIYLLLAHTNGMLKNYTTALYYINKSDSLNKNRKITEFKIKSQLEKVNLQIMNIIDPNTNKEVLTIFGKDRISSLTNAIKVINELMKYYVRINGAPQTLNCFELLSYAYLELGDKNRTIYYMNKYKSLNDSLTGTNQIRNLTLAEVGYKIEMQNNKLELQKNAIAQSEKNIFYIGISFIVLCIVLVIIFILWQRNRRHKLELIEKNSIITDTNIELEKLLEVVSEKQQQIEMANIELNKANATKDKFFSILSHDLKSPFTGILGLSELLSSEAENMKTKEITSIGTSIHNSAKYTFELLNQLLDWSRSQLGAIQYEPAQLNLHYLIDRILKHCQSAATIKNISINTNYCDYPHILGDDNMLSTVIRNLLNNAIKFTQTGGKIKIETNIEDNFIKISIRDNGIGIDSDKLRILFEFGSITSTLGTNNEKGTGLGLILCKEFVAKHGGKIWAESEVGKGSNFQILLPVQISDLQST